MVKVSLIDVVKAKLKKEDLVYTLPDKLEVKIGRDKGNDIALGSRGTDVSVKIGKENVGMSEDFISTVSRNHCVIYNNKGIVSVEDVGSRNGTYVNDIKIPANDSMPLKNDDILRLGYYILKVKMEED